MDLSTGELITIGTILVGAGMTWGRMSQRFTSQGKRIGTLEEKVSKLEGVASVLRYRSKTKPQGEKA